MGRGAAAKGKEVGGCTRGEKWGETARVWEG
jgi:hypothetical protein